MAVLGLRFCVRALSSCGKRGPLLIAVRGPPTIAASPVAEHRLQTRRLSNCGSRAQLLRSTRDPPRPGLEPVSPALAGRLSTTAPPGKPYYYYYHYYYVRLIKSIIFVIIISVIIIIDSFEWYFTCIISHHLHNNPWKVSTIFFSFLATPLGMWNFPDQGSNPCPLQWKHGVLTTGPPGKSTKYYYYLQITDEETGVQRNEITCPRSSTYWTWFSNPGLSDPKAPAPNLYPTISIQSSVFAEWINDSMEKRAARMPQKKRRWPGSQGPQDAVLKQKGKENVHIFLMK